MKNYFSNFLFFHNHLKHRVFVVLILSVLGGIMDGFGLAMFLPMLEMVSSDTKEISGDQMGNLTFLIHGLQYIGLSLNLFVVLMVMLFFFIMKGFFKFIEYYSKAIYRQYFIKKIRVEVIDGLSKYGYNNFVTADIGRIQNTMSGEVSSVSQAFYFYMTVIQQGVLLLTYAVLALLANPKFAIMVLIGGILTNVIFRKLYTVTKTLSRKLTKDNHGFQSLVIQQVSQFKYLKASGQISSYSDRLIKKVGDIETSQRKIGVLNAIIQGTREPILMTVVIGVILLEVIVLGGNLGLIVLSILFFYRALNAVMGVQTSWNKFISLIGSLENVTTFIDELKKGQEVMGDKPFKSFKKSLSLKGVSFQYAGSIPTLKDINLEVKKYDTIAFVGESGSGKTTLINVLSGLLFPDSGKYLIDDEDSQLIKISDFQKKIGYITQDPVIFNDTIFNNVTFWAPPTPEAIKRFDDALKLASIYDFVKTDLPEKEATLLGNNGINLSGGQKQRISIARELFKEIDILILDEATSALDSETELSIQQNIDNLKGQFTIFIVAHRLATVKNADRVVFLKSGQIESEGTFDELKEINEDFRRMVSLQEIG